MEQNHNKRVLF